MRTMMRSIFMAAAFACSAAAHRDVAAAQPPADDSWVSRMREVHQKFTGRPGTFAHFGDSITVSMAFWAPLAGDVRGLDAEASGDLAAVKEYLLPECWRDWKGPEFGNEGSTTILWADEHLNEWLARDNPEVALVMFGTNDLTQLTLDEYATTTRRVVQRCLGNGTVELASTNPPRSGMLDESRQFADAVRTIAHEERIPLVDYFGEILRRRPDDWDGTLPAFANVPGDEYQVPTLISRDGVHPSFPRDFTNNFSDQALRQSGYGLRSYLVMRAYADIIDKVLRQPPAAEDEPAIEPTTRGRSAAIHGRPAHFPHRIWAACDFEGQTPDYGWFGTPQAKNIPTYPGNTTALAGINGSAGDSFAMLAGVNPVPGPRIGKANQLFVRYRLAGTSEATFQHFSLTTEDNQHVHVTGLVQDIWSEVVVNFSRDAARNDGSPGTFAEGERLDDFKLLVGVARQLGPYELAIDDVIFFSNDPDRPPEKESFPNRVIFLAAFDTGEAAKYWPGEFDLVEDGLPAGAAWRAARAVDRKDSGGKWIRLEIRPPRPVGVHTKLRFRYFIQGAGQLTAQIFDATVQDNRHVVLEGLARGEWSTAYVDFSKDGRRNDGSGGSFDAGNLVDDLFFFVDAESDAGHGMESLDLIVDEVVLFDAG